MPAATRPITGRPSSSLAAYGSKPECGCRERPSHFDGARVPRALRCSSAAFGDLKPSSWAISAWVGGAVVFQAALDEGEDLGLAGRQLLHVVALCFIQ